MNKAEVTQLIMEELTQWEEIQQCQTSGYEYEKSFVETWQTIGQKVFQKSIGKVSSDKNVKKKFKHVWEL